MRHFHADTFSEKNYRMQKINLQTLYSIINWEPHQLARKVNLQ